MGGVLPVIPQRVLGIGGTAGMVHPSTGITSFHFLYALYSAWLTGSRATIEKNYYAVVVL